MKAKHFILGALLVAAPALAKDPVDKSTQAVKLPRADVDMLKKLHQANREEIELGQVAQQVSMRDDVKAFGKMMVDDHKMADEKITKMADEHGVPLGDDADAMRLADKFRKKDAVKEFDKDYLTRMVKDHDKVINMIGTKSDDLKAELQASLNGMLPTLRKHRTEAKRLLDDVKAAKTASSGSRQGRSDRIRR
ncbi:MAG TPA: DUF4142 domain-containing protein [Myxococcaceae bacterium]|nr:DUF4142 domain-containing protein [Myxococcaceae bacterium]